MVIFGYGVSPGGQPASVSPPQGPSQDIPQQNRAGHFHDLSKFMASADKTHREDPQFLLNNLEWGLGHDAILVPGTIIWIKDKLASTRICDRVMLVLRKNTQSSMTCVSFCWHADLWQRELQETHLQVVPTNTDSPQSATSPTPPRPTASSPPNRGSGGSAVIMEDLPRSNVEVDLFLKSQSFFPQSNVYLNCEELWNVEREVDVAVLGKVAGSSFRLVCDNAKGLFGASLDKAIRRMRSPQSPSSPIVVPATSSTAAVDVPPPRPRDERRRDEPHRRDDVMRRRDSGAGRTERRYHEQRDSGRGSRRNSGGGIRAFFLG